MPEGRKVSVKSLVKILKDEGLDATIRNPQDLVVDHLMYFKTADKNSLVFYTGNDASQVSHLHDCVLLCSPDLNDLPANITGIATKDPKLAYYILAQEFAPPPPQPGIHATAIVSKAARIDTTASIGPYCVLEECSIGEGSILHSHVTVYQNTSIGKRTIVEANSCIGATGVMWAWGPKGKKFNMPQFGGTVIGDDCFIGSNATIVRGSLLDTVVNNECHIAHGAMIGHDCQIGEQSHLGNGVAMGGSTIIGKRCFIGSGVSFRPKVNLGDSIIVGVGSVVINNFHDKGTVLVGTPAHPLDRVKEEPVGMPKPVFKP